MSDIAFPCLQAPMRFHASFLRRRLRAVKRCYRIPDELAIIVTYSEIPRNRNLSFETLKIHSYTVTPAKAGVQNVLKKLDAGSSPA
ncbi:MAG: hypothetical protein KKD24_07810 [Proteobacteria bacterium]|nr:hypothetical protein [Pseudomonadota bacterium]